MTSSARTLVTLTLTLVLLAALTPALTSACRSWRGICRPAQRSCGQRGGMCSVTRNGCVCVARHTFYGYQPRYDAAYMQDMQNRQQDMYNLRQERYRNRMNPEHIETGTNMMVEMSRVYNVMN